MLEMGIDFRFRADAPHKQTVQAAKLNQAIWASLKELGYIRKLLHKMGDATCHLNWIV